MDTNSQVQQAVCPCPLGNDGWCNHLAATLFAMEDACKKSVSTTSESEDDLPCTSKPCTWSIPKKRKQEPSTVQAVKFVKHVYGKKDKECSSSSTVRTTHNEKKSNTDYNALLEKIKAVEEKTGRKLVSIISFHNKFQNIQLQLPKKHHSHQSGTLSLPSKLHHFLCLI